MYFNFVIYFLSPMYYLDMPVSFRCHAHIVHHYLHHPIIRTLESKGSCKLSSLHEQSVHSTLCSRDLKSFIFHSMFAYLTLIHHWFYIYSTYIVYVYIHTCQYVYSMYCYSNVIIFEIFENCNIRNYDK